MRINCRNVALLLVFTLLLPILAQAENQGLVWAVKGKHCTVWLAGTIHFANQDLYPLPQSMERAFEQSEVLAVEADITKMTDEDVRVLTALASYPPGETLSKNISAKTLRAFKGVGMDLAPFDLLRPWYAVMTGVTLKLAEMGFTPDMGLDLHLLQRANEMGKPVVELESLQAQFKLMAGLAEKTSSHLWPSC